MSTAPDTLEVLRAEAAVWFATALGAGQDVAVAIDTATEIVTEGLKRMTTGIGDGQARCTAYALVVKVLVDEGLLALCPNHLQAQRHLKALGHPLTAVKTSPPPASTSLAEGVEKAALEAYRASNPSALPMPEDEPPSPSLIATAEEAHRLADLEPVQTPAPGTVDPGGTYDRAETIKALRQNLRVRSGKTWSVTGGRGTAYGWIRVCAPPARMASHSMTPEDRALLGELLGVEASHQGESIPPNGNYRQEFVERSRGLVPSVHGVPDWD